MKPWTVAINSLRAHARGRMHLENSMRESFFDGMAVLSWGLSPASSDQPRLFVASISERSNYGGVFVF